MSNKETLLGAANAGPPPVFISSSIARSNSSGITVTAPTGIQNGDLLVAIGFTPKTSTTVTLPSGFSIQTFIGTGNVTAGVSSFVATKVAASESGNYTFTWTGNPTIAILVYRNATTVNSIGATSEVNSTSVAAPSITPSYEGTLIAYFATVKGATISSSPSGMTLRASKTDPISGALYLYDLAAQSATATGSKSATWDGTSDDTISFLLQITNEPNIAPTFVASAQNATSATTSLTINKPTGTQQNDLMVAIVQTDASSSWTSPAGWTEVADKGGKPGVSVAYKVAGASEGSNYTFTAGSSGDTTGSILTYRSATYDTVGAFTTGSSTLTVPGVTVSASQSILIVTGVNSSSTTVTYPTYMTSRTSNSIDSPSFAVVDEAIPKGPSRNILVGVGGSINVAGIMLSIKPSISLV